ncbi:MAG: hypothetical protein IPN54_10205 [Bacteroidetes bacterium]|nr:hypothetical protein [Bacteroidota bacterium]
MSQQKNKKDNRDSDYGNSTDTQTASAGKTENDNAQRNQIQAQLPIIHQRKKVKIPLLIQRNQSLDLIKKTWGNWSSKFLSHPQNLILVLIKKRTKLMMMKTAD